MERGGGGPMKIKDGVILHSIPEISTFFSQSLFSFSNSIVWLACVFITSCCRMNALCTCTRGEL